MLWRWCQNSPKQRSQGLQVDWWVYYHVVRVWRATEVLSRRSGEQSRRSGDVITIGMMSSSLIWSYSTKLWKLIHRNRCKTALRRKAPAVELSHVYDQEVPWPKCEEIEVGGMSQNASVIESENVEEREWQGRSRSPWSMLTRRGQVKARRDGRADASWRTNFPPSARWWKSMDRRWCESGTTWTSQYKEWEKHRDRTEWTSRRSREHLSSTIVNAKVYSHGWGERVKINWVFQPCKSRQDTSQFGLIFLRRKMSTQHWSILVMSQVNTSRVQSEQQNRVGVLVTHHPAWMSHHTGGSRQGHPVPNSGKAVGGPIRRSTSQQLTDTKCKSCCTETKEKLIFKKEREWECPKTEENKNKNGHFWVSKADRKDKHAKKNLQNCWEKSNKNVKNILKHAEVSGRTFEKRIKKRRQDS